MSESLLPNRDCALVEERKIRDYLLNISHPSGGSKAQFFAGRGASLAKWTAFRDVLLDHARSNPVTGIRQHPQHPVSLHQVDCHVTMPDGSRPCIRSVWEIRGGQPCPRLVTAHPLSE